jgi:hypothetical protein
MPYRSRLSGFNRKVNIDNKISFKNPAFHYSLPGAGRTEAYILITWLGVRDNTFVSLFFNIDL